MADPAELDETSEQLRRRLTVLAGVVCGAWLVLLVAWKDAPFALTFDDAYYFFEIARNAADGHISTFDRINETNGYMPLWQALCVPVYAVGLDGTAAVRVLLGAQIVVWFVALRELARLVTGAVAGWPRLTGARRAGSVRACSTVLTVVFVAFVANPFVARTTHNGLESGVTDLLFVLLLRHGVRARGRWLGGTAGQRWTSGVLLSAAFFGRTDAALLIAVVGLWSLAELREDRTDGLRRLVEVFAIPGLAIPAYLVANQIAFGTPLQISGTVKRTENTATDFVVAVIFVVLAAITSLRAHRRSDDTGDDPRFGRTKAFFGATGWFASFCVLSVGYYSTLSAQRWLWYFVPVVVYLVALGLHATADLAEMTCAEARKGTSPRRALAPLTVLLLVPLVVVSATQARQFSDPELRSIQLANRDAGLWITENLPDDAVLASWDAGAVGYYAEQSVVNLDGVVNSLEWHQAGEDGRRAEFLRAEGVGYIVNHGIIVDGNDPDVFGWVEAVFGAETAEGLELVKTFPFVYSGKLTGAKSVGSGRKQMAVFIYRIPEARELGAVSEVEFAEA